MSPKFTSEENTVEKRRNIVDLGIQKTDTPDPALD